MKSKRRSDRVPRLLDSIAFLSVALVLAWLAGTSLIHQAKYVDLHRSARALERGRTLGLPAVERRSGDVERLIVERGCDDLGLRAGMTLSVAAVDRSNPALDFEKWAAAADRSRRLLRKAVACSPSYGMLWARLADAERLIAASFARVVPLAAMSVRLAPAELGVIRTRFRIWRRAAVWLPANATPPLAADMRTILERAHLSDIKRMIGGSSFLRGLAFRGVPQTSGERQSELARLRLDRDDDGTPVDQPRFDLLDKPRR